MIIQYFACNLNNSQRVPVCRGIKQIIHDNHKSCQQRIKVFENNCEITDLYIFH